MTAPDPVVLALESGATAEARALQEAFFAELAARYPDRDGGPALLDPVEIGPPDGAWIVVRLDGEPTGCGGLRRLDGDTCEIKRVYLAPELRGRGVARRLMARLHDEARDRGYRAVRLDTGSAQPEAHALYTALGYRPIPDYNGNPLASFWFELAL